MKLLLDQNISYRVAKSLVSIYPGIKQVKEVGMENASDMEIWQYAKRNGYSIITFDADFCDIALIKGIPPKIIWLRTGNITTKYIIDILKENQFIISEFINIKEYKDVDCLEIF